MANSHQHSEWKSRIEVASRVVPGVRFTIRRMSFARRLELMKKIRDLATKASFFQAGFDEKNQMEASLLRAEIDRLYVEWGLESVTGLELDGQDASPDMLIQYGPEALFLEVLEEVRSECGLSESERKN